MPRKGHPEEGHSNGDQARGDTMVVIIALNRSLPAEPSSVLGASATTGLELVADLSKDPTLGVRRQSADRRRPHEQ